MNSEFADPLTSRIIAAAISVHREIGPGFLESIYEEAMGIALTEADLSFVRQVAVPINFHGRKIGEHRLDLLVADEIVVELKAIKELEDVHYAIMRSYLKATDLKCGLIMNFAAPTLQVKRIGAEFRRRQ
jgi:GxxExxY protein